MEGSRVAGSHEERTHRETEEASPLVLPEYLCCLGWRAIVHVVQPVDVVLGGRLPPLVALASIDTYA